MSDTASTIQMEPASVGIDFSPEAFDEQILHHGLIFRHFRGMKDPVGLVSRFDTRRPDEDHSGASNGLVYADAGCIAAIFTGNSKELRALEGGAINSAVAQVTVARFYVDKPDQRVYLAPMDRLELAEPVLVPRHQLVQFNGSGDDRLDFPAEQVLDLVDAQGVRYQQDTDFCIHDGRLRWKGPRNPGINPETMVGRVYGVRYLYRAHYYVDQLLHEIRMARVEDPITGQRSMVQMQQSARIAREYVYRNKLNDPQAANPSDPRQAPAPADSGFGPR